MSIVDNPTARSCVLPMALFIGSASSVSRTLGGVLTGH